MLLTQTRMADAAATVIQQIKELGQITDEPGRLTRTFCSPAMRRANELVSCWMRRAGMIVREDGIGNLIGNYRARAAGSKMNKGKPGILLLGSHLDTVRDAGRFDAFRPERVEKFDFSARGFDGHSDRYVRGHQSPRFTQEGVSHRFIESGDGRQCGRADGYRNNDEYKFGRSRACFAPCHPEWEVPILPHRL